MGNFKVAFYYLCRSLGLFHLSRFLMRRRLLILCFHGVALDGEEKFQPDLFMREPLFRQRLKAIRQAGFPVLPLADALTGLKNNSLPPNSVSLTIDDGFYNVLAKTAPIIEEYKLPATLYLTSYYVEKGVPVFRLVVQYLFWKTSKIELDASDHDWGPKTPVALEDSAGREQIIWEIIDYGESHCDEQGRQNICHELGACLNVDYDAITKSRILSLLRPEELPLLQKLGIDIQLHTHRHSLPLDSEAECRREIRENKAFLEKALGQEKSHLCYPSGIWSKEQWPCLEAEGIESATTCEPGLNTADTPRLGLYRILDQDDLSQIEFEAELFGFCELIRLVTRRRRDS